MKIVSVFAVLAMTSMLVFGGEPVPAPAEKDVPKSAEDIPVAPLPDGIFLQAGELNISIDAINKIQAIYVASEMQRDPKFKLTDEKRDEFNKEISVRLLEHAVIEKYAKDNKLQLPKEKSDQKLNDLKKELASTGKSYEQALADIGQTKEQFEQYWNAQIAVVESLKGSVAQADIDKTMSEVSESIPMRRASHILYMYKGSERAPKEVTRSKDEAKAAAAEALKKIKAGEDFAKIAKAGSDCPSKEEGGDLNYFPRKGAMAEPFSEATYKLAKVGDVTDIVETVFGYHIIKLTELKDDKEIFEKTGVKTKEELVDKIREHLSNEKMRKQMNQLMGEALKTAKFNQKMIAPKTKAEPKVEPKVEPKP